MYHTILNTSGRSSRAATLPYSLPSAVLPHPPRVPLLNSPGPFRRPIALLISLVRLGTRHSTTHCACTHVGLLPFSLLFQAPPPVACGAWPLFLFQISKTWRRHSSSSHLPGSEMKPESPPSSFFARPGTSPRRYPPSSLHVSLSLPLPRTGSTHTSHIPR